MKQTIATLLILGSSIAGFSQDKNFDLSKYKFPDYKRHELELNFNSSGNSNSDFTEFPQSNNNPVVIYDQSKLDLNSSLRLSYNFKYLSRKRIISHILSFNGDMNYSKNRNLDETTKEFQPQLHLSSVGYKRIYLTEDRYFIEGIYESYLDASSRKITYTHLDANDDSKSNSLRLLAGVGVGIGRIEQVGDLFQGYYIIEKLKQQNSLSRELKEQDIFEYARLISKLKNKRFFDYRLQKIAELQSLDSILHSQNLIKHSDISYFTTLNDYWSYGSFWERKSGKELKLHLSPEFLRNYYHTESYSESPIKTNLVSKILFDCSKQLDLSWERNIHIGIINTTLLAKNGDVSDSYPDNFIETNASFGYGFFPDSRTRLKLFGNYSGYELLNYVGELASKSWLNKTSLNFEANYFISPQLQITGNFSGNYWFSEHNSSHGHNTKFNLGFRYAIF
jgi:hypothetical protein